MEQDDLSEFAIDEQYRLIVLGPDGTPLASARLQDIVYMSDDEWKATKVEKLDE